MSSSSHVNHGVVVWVGKPWIVPAAVIRSVILLVIVIIFLLLEGASGYSTYFVAGLPLWVWTTLLFIIIWLLTMFNLLIYRVSRVYILRQDGLEIRRGILRLHSFVVTPAGFGDLLVYQSIGGRIFGYGDITVNSQGERQTKLLLVRDPFAVADTIRDIMGKPLVRVDNRF